MNRQAVLSILRDVAPELRARYGVVGARLFGSVARGDADNQSDIDIAVRFDNNYKTDVMALCGVSGLLSGLLGRDVDVVALPARDQGLNAAIEREAVVAF
jgi:predicted nucleotidyltransferase